METPVPMFTRITVLAKSSHPSPPTPELLKSALENVTSATRRVYPSRGACAVISLSSSLVASDYDANTVKDLSSPCVPGGPKPEAARIVLCPPEFSSVGGLVLLSAVGEERTPLGPNPVYRET